MMLYYYMLFIIYLHLIGCMWFFFIEQTYKESLIDSRYQPWVPPYDYYDGADQFWERYEKGDQQMFLYWVCLYYSVLVIGGNELGPKELKELVFCVMINLTGAIFQAYIFGELAVLIAQVGTKSKKMQEQIDNANTAMDNVALPESLRDEIREFFKSTTPTKMQADELKEFLEKLSPSLQIRVRTHMFVTTLRDHNKIIKHTMSLISNPRGSQKGSSRALALSAQ